MRLGRHRSNPWMREVTDIWGLGQEAGDLLVGVSRVPGEAFELAEDLSLLLATVIQM